MTTDDWTPVTEGLPEDDGLYAVTVKEGPEFDAFVTVEWFDKGRFSKWRFTHSIVAWRPLPEPWKADE